MVVMVVGCSCGGYTVIGEKSNCFDCVVMIFVVYSLIQ